MCLIWTVWKERTQKASESFDVINDVILRSFLYMLGVVWVKFRLHNSLSLSLCLSHFIKLIFWVVSGAREVFCVYTSLSLTPFFWAYIHLVYFLVLLIEMLLHDTKN